jgi:hypothetical protein
MMRVADNLGGQEKRLPEDSKKRSFSDQDTYYT